MIFFKYFNKNLNCYHRIDISIPGLDTIILLGEVNLIRIYETKYIWK